MQFLITNSKIHILGQNKTNTTPKELCLVVCNGHGTKLNIKHDWASILIQKKRLELNIS